MGIFGAFGPPAAGVSPLTLGSLIKHLAFVEDLKLTTMLLGRDLVAPWDAVNWRADADWPWPRPGGESEDALSLRRLLVDIIEEYARHVGHADLIREIIDGLVGEDPPGPVYPYEPPATSADYVPRGGQDAAGPGAVGPPPRAGKAW